MRRAKIELQKNFKAEEAHWIPVEDSPAEKVLDKDGARHMETV
jgi:hypothetical protein